MAQGPNATGDQLAQAATHSSLDVGPTPNLSVFSLTHLSQNTWIKKAYYKLNNNFSSVTVLPPQSYLIYGHVTLLCDDTT